MYRVLRIKSKNSTAVNMKTLLQRLPEPIIASERETRKGSSMLQRKKKQVKGPANSDHTVVLYPFNCVPSGGLISHFISDKNRAADELLRRPF